MKNKRHNPYFSLQTEKKSRKERFLSKTDGESVYINVLPLFFSLHFAVFYEFILFIYFLYTKSAKQLIEFFWEKGRKKLQIVVKYILRIC